MSSKPDFALYGYFRSSAAFRARIALNLKGIKPELRFVHLLRDGGQHSAEYKTLNPQELIPALLHEGHLITQSMAIIEYLDEIVRRSRRSCRKTLTAVLRVREISYVVGCDIHPVNNLRVGQYMMSRFKLTADDAASWQRHWIRVGFDALETMLAGSQDTGAYCHGETPTMADVLLIPQCANARREKLELDPWPTIARIEAHALRHPAFEAALPKNQPDAE